MIGTMYRENVHEILRFALNDNQEATEYALMVER